MARPFKSELVIDEKICESPLRAYHIGFDQNQFRLQPLVDIICDVIPEFSLGYYEGENIPITEVRRKLRDAAIRLYTTDKYSRRGEFGEIVLHLLLRDFCGSFPLFSKINFKDSTNTTVKGFDGIHVVEKDGDRKLWLGESKFYTSGIEGIKALADDLREHIKEDYLRKEFLLIANKVPHNVPNRDYWLNLINERNTLDGIFSGICIPMVCTYSSDIFKKHNANTDAYFAEFKAECEKLHEEFRGIITATPVDVILMLLPVPNKADLATKLHERLKHMQNI